MEKNHFKRLLIFCLLSSTSFAQELSNFHNQAHTANEEELLVSSTMMTMMSLKVVNESEKKDCPDSIDKPKKPQTDEIRQAYCFCDLSKFSASEIQSIPFLGTLEKVDYALTTGNDNGLHGFMKYIPVLKNYNGDDRGRTFSMDNDFSLYGTKGEIKLGWSSTGFGRPKLINNSYYNDEDKQNLEFLEHNSIYLRGDKYYKKDDQLRFRFIGELRLDHFNDHGPGAYAIQKKWHEMMGDKAALHYNYLDHRSSESAVTLKLGAGVDKTLDISNWRCVLSAEVLLGASQYQGGKGLASVKISSDITHKSLPWLAVSAWTSAAKGLDGKEKHHGLNLSLPFKVKSMSVTPFLGIERHETANDLNYSRKDGEPYEAIHTLGLRISY